MCRAAPGLWAIGDVTGVGRLHPCVDVPGRDRRSPTSWAGRPRPPTTRALPRVTFTDPEIGSVGLSEASAKAAGLNVQDRLLRPSHRRPGAGSKRSTTRGSSSWSRTPTAACSSARPRSGPCGGEVLSMLTLAVHASVPDRQARHDDLRLPDLPPGRRGGRAGAGFLSTETAFCAAGVVGSPEEAPGGPLG